MIRHTVCFKLHDSSDESKLGAKKMLLSMDGNVPMLRGIDVGCDFLCSARSYDVILNVLLDDEKALEDYQKDKYHCEVVKEYMHKVASATVAIDVVL